MNKKIIIGFLFISLIFISVNVSGAFSLYDTLDFGGFIDVTEAPAPTVFTVYDTLSFGGNISVTAASSPPAQGNINKAPTITNLNPNNKSTDISISGNMSANINLSSSFDFNWTIELKCNGTSQNASGLHEKSGSKGFTYSGLDYSTTYTYYVNATNTTGGGVNTSWGFFTTESAPPPAQVFTLLDTLSFGGKIEVTSPPSSSSYAKKITIDHNKVNETITNFPLLVKFDSDSDLASHAQDNGWDLIFKNSDNTSTYYHEIEKFDGSTGELVAWVNVTSVSHATDTILWLHYGDGSYTDTSDSTNVWDRDRYKSVYHLNSTSDSTYMGNDLTARNSPSLQNDGGKCGGAYLFDDTVDSYLDVSSIVDLSSQTVITTSFWVNMVKFADDGADYEGGLMFGTKEGSNRAVLHWAEEEGVDNNWLKFKFLLQNPDGFIMSGTDNGVNMGNEGEWHHSTAVFHQDYVILYVDGKKIVNKAGSTIAMNQLTNDTFNIGRYYETNWQYFDAYMDEVRVSNIDLSANYINATFLNMNNPSSFYTLGSEVINIGYNETTFSNPSPANGSVGNSLQPTVSVDIEDPDGDSFDVTFQSNYAGSWTTYKTQQNQNNGTFTWSFTGADSYNTLYYWRVYANDGVINNSVTYHFTTTPRNVAPSGFSATTNDRDTIELSWTNDGNNNTVVEFSSANISNSPYGTGTEIYNGTDTSFSHSSLNYDTTYYYKAFSWNDTVGVYSIGNVTDEATTTANLPPVTSNPFTNNSENVSTSFTWNCTINDPEGDTFNFTIECSDDNSSTGTDVNNGSKTLSLSSLDTSTKFTVWVNHSGIDKVYYFTTSGLYNPQPPTNLVATSVSYDEIDLTWTVGANASHTWIERNSIDTWNRGSGTLIYNGTGNSYNDKGLSNATRYYYRAWSYNNLDKDNTIFNNTNVTANNYTFPQAPQNPSGRVINNNLVMNWDAGNGGDSYVLVQKTNSYSSSISDGTIIYNNTFTNHTKTTFNSTDYYTAFTFNSTSSLYSFGTNISWGLLQIYVYREDKPHIEIGNYTVFVTNPVSGETYYNTSQNNPFEIGIDDIPQGNDITIQITKDGYKTRSVVQDLEVNSKYNISFYLPPDSSGSPSSEQGEDWYVEPEENEQSLKQTTSSVSNHSNDLDITLDCIPDEIILVEGYNESLYGHWFTIPDDKYSYAADVVTIDNSVLDANTTTCRVSYYCDVEGAYSEHYIILVKDETGSGISDVKVDIKRYINTTDMYSTVISGYTDTNGQFEVDLMPNVQYVVNLTESSGGYVNISETWMPPEITYSQDAIKTYILEYATIQPQPDTNPAECININAVISDTTLYVNFSNSCNYFIDDIQVYVYMSNLSNDVTSLFATNTSTDDTSFNFVIYNINNSNTYTIVIFYNNSNWGMQKLTIFIKGTDVISPDTDAEEIDNMFDVLFGHNPFGWHNIIMFFIFVAAMFYADNRDIGKVLIFIGGLFLFLSIYVGLQSSIATVAGGVLPALFIIVGIIKLWIDSNK